MTNGPSVEAVALASKAYEDAPTRGDAGEWHDWGNAIARAVDAHTEALRTRLAACEEALRFYANEKNTHPNGAHMTPFVDGKPDFKLPREDRGRIARIALAALKEPSRG